MSWVVRMLLLAPLAVAARSAVAQRAPADSGDVSLELALGVLAQPHWAPRPGDAETRLGPSGVGHVALDLRPHRWIGGARLVLDGAPDARVHFRAAEGCDPACAGSERAAGVALLDAALDVFAQHTVIGRTSLRAAAGIGRWGIHPPPAKTTSICALYSPASLEHPRCVTDYRQVAGTGFHLAGAVFRERRGYDLEFEVGDYAHRSAAGGLLHDVVVTFGLNVRHMSAPE